MNIYLIGAGGTASYLMPVLARAIRNTNIDAIHIIDRDRVETHNLERQLFGEDDVDKPKASTLADLIRPFCKIPVYSRVQWFHEGIPVDDNSVFIVCADNHPARLAVLEVCDRTDSVAFICGNETYSADAYYYEPSFRGTLADPRVRYPEIVTDKTDDRVHPPCNAEETLAETPQLAAANFLSANFAMQLFQLWIQLAPAMDMSQVRQSLPIEYNGNKTTINKITLTDIQKEIEQ